MRLLDCDAKLLQLLNIGRKTFAPTAKFSKAVGVMFVCPQCLFDSKQDRPGVHSIICWAPSVPQTFSPTPGRWNLVGTGLHDLSLVAGSSSVLLSGGCAAHFHIVNGVMVNCGQPKWDAWVRPNEL